MALTLPYPDMVFVPLDILTAEEQNQLVGNIEFLANQFPLSASNIANGAIGSDQLAAGAVTNEKIGTSAVKSQNVDWTTFGWRPLASEFGLSGTRVGASFDATGATMLKATIVAQMSAESWLDFRVYDGNFGQAWGSTWRTMRAGSPHEQTTVTTTYGSTASYLNNAPRDVDALALLNATLARATPTSKWTVQSILGAEAWTVQIASNELGKTSNQLSMALESDISLTGGISVVGFFPS